ncbi:hypothetical protein [Agaribacter flavus]|uniref:Uncharacterized protein n=1 Tax=Agaribacter flavus TaxID=1902781 RepID=A0ABV7FQK6_9ALTE
MGDAFSPISQKFVDSLVYLSVCKAAHTIKCLVHWETIGDGGGQLIVPFSQDAICVNPLTWTKDDRYADKALHLGADSISGQYVLDNSLMNKKANFDEPLITTKFTGAKRKDGLLYVNDPTHSQYAALGLMSDHAMHGVNFAIFHMNIRENASLRAKSFMKER